MEGNVYSNGGSSGVMVESGTVTNENSRFGKKNNLLFKILIPIVVLIISLIIVVTIILNNSNDSEVNMDNDVLICEVEGLVNEYKERIINARTDEEKFSAYLDRADMLSRYWGRTGCDVGDELSSDLEMAEHFAKSDDDRVLIDEIRFYVLGHDGDNQKKSITMEGE